MALPQAQALGDCPGLPGCCSLIKVRLGYQSEARQADVQGAEIPVLLGGMRALSRAELVLLEARSKLFASRSAM